MTFMRKNMLPKKLLTTTFVAGLGLLVNTQSSMATVISVNFHADDVGTEADPFVTQAEHELSAGEIAGLVAVDGQFWNNINVGLGGLTNTSTAIFPSTDLIDDSGATSATLAPSAESTFFVGHAASKASDAHELELSGNQDDLYNSYLALNGPNGDGEPLDAVVLNVSGLSSAFTSAGYYVIIYSDTDRGTANNTGVRTNTFILTAGDNETTVFTEDDGSATNPTFNNTFIESDGINDSVDYSNYVIVSGLTADSFTLEVLSDDGGRAGINGFQIVAVPEPSSLALLGLGGMFVLRRRRD